MTARMRFSAESLTALGLSADRLLSNGSDLPQALAFPRGVRVTSAKADGDGVVVNLSGASLLAGGDASGEVTGSYSVDSKGRRSFTGFYAVDDAAAEPDEGEPGATDTTTQGG